MAVLCRLNGVEDVDPRDFMPMTEEEQAAWDDEKERREAMRALFNIRNIQAQQKAEADFHAQRD